MIEIIITIEKNDTLSDDIFRIADQIYVRFQVFFILGSYLFLSRQLPVVVLFTFHPFPQDVGGMAQLTCLIMRQSRRDEVKNVFHNLKVYSQSVPAVRTGFWLWRMTEGQEPHSRFADTGSILFPSSFSSSCPERQSYPEMTGAWRLL